MHYLPRRFIMTVALAGTVIAAASAAADFRLGTAIDAAQAERSITIAADARWANVDQGEAIRFVSGSNVFGWKFDGTRSAIDLSQVAPAGFIGRPFMVYVKPPHRAPPGN